MTRPTGPADPQPAGSATLDRLSGEGYRVRNLGRGVVGSTGAGVASALFGIGGGIIKVPLMNLAMGVPLRVATATSNLMIGITAAASAVIYLIRGEIDPYVAGPTAIGVFLGATLGSRLGPPGRPALPAPAVRRRAGLHRGPDAPAGRRNEPIGVGATAPGGMAHRPAAHRDDLHAVALLVVGVLLMVAAGISPLAGGPPFDPAVLVAELTTATPAGFLWLGLLVRDRHADRARHRRGDLVRGWAANGSWSWVAVAILLVIVVGVVSALTFTV